LEKKKIKKIFLDGGAFLPLQKLTFLKKSHRKNYATRLSMGFLNRRHGPLYNKKKKTWGAPTKYGGAVGLLFLKKINSKF
jgi:hypothetical protein